MRKYGKQHRKNHTEAELVFKKELQRAGLKFRSEIYFKYYIADFVLWHKNAIIEIDGGYHNTEKQKEKDKTRDSFFRRNGIDVYRFTNEEVLNNSKEIVKSFLEMPNKTESYSDFKYYNNPVH